MYLPRHFEETRTDVLQSLVRAHPLGTLVTMTPRGLEANHIPFEIVLGDSPFGTLRGHVARANPVWREAVQDVEALVVFGGPSAYISPSGYATKRETGKVVPTWNYAVVHAHGPLRVIDDVEWLRAFVTALTARHEANQADPWQVSDAPPAFIEANLRQIVGIEIGVARVSGKWKVSQNRPERDRVGAAQALRDEGSESARAMAALIDERGAEGRGD